MMKIQVGGLSEGVHEYRFHEKASDLGVSGDFQDGIDVEAILEKTGNQMYLRARINAIGLFLCDRCLAQFPRGISSTYRMCYMTEGADPGNLDPSEIQRISPGNNVIDITEDVRQTAILSVPLKLLCREDCKGLCPYCGKNKNIESCACTGATVDSRWEKLRFIRNDN